MADINLECSDWQVLLPVPSGPDGQLHYRKGVCSVMSGCCYGFGFLVSLCRCNVGVQSVCLRGPVRICEGAQVSLHVSAARLPSFSWSGV